MATVKPKFFTAKYESVCAHCGDPIELGDLALVLPDGRGAIHARRCPRSDRERAEAAKPKQQTLF